MHLKKRSIFQRAGDALSGRGFYIVLALCAAVIGVSGYYLYSVSSAVPQAGVDVSAPAEVTVGEDDPLPLARLGADSESINDMPEEEPPAAPAPAEEEPAPETAAPAEVTAEAEVPKPVSYIWPVQGSVTQPFSAQELVYCPAMGDWRTHEAVDLAATAGTQVRATAPGTVASVETDVLLGTVVTVSHAGGLTSQYANLQSQPTVNAGDKVAQGDVLGAVGTTATLEADEAAHLHFAMFQDGLPVAPEDYLPVPLS